MLRANDALVNAAAVGADIIAWNAVEIDSNSLANNDLATLKLLQSPLWPEGIPDFIIKLWNSMQTRLLAREGEHWEVWTNWYDARLDPSRRIPCYSPPDLKLEEARVLLPDELWEQGPAAVNARIRELIEESGCAGDKFPLATTKTSFISDAPTGEEDHLARADLALVLANKLNRIWDEQQSQRLDSGRPAPGFIVHLDAPWGGGKTSFATMLASILNPWCLPRLPQWLQALDLKDTLHRRYNRPWRIVWYNAWQHEHMEPPWWSFNETIRKSLGKQLSPFKGFRKAPSLGEMDSSYAPCWPYRLFQRVVLWGREYGWRFWMSGMGWPLTGLLVISALIYWLWPENSSKSLTGTDIRNWLLAITNLLGVLGIIWNMLFRFRQVIAPGMAEAQSRWHFGAEDPFDHMRRHFHAMMEIVHNPVLVIIDDIDRCQPAHVVDLVRGMQTILTSPRVVFLLLGDRDWIEQSFDSMHKEMKGIDVGPEHRFGGRFVEKAIQLSLVLPEVTSEQRLRYVRALLRTEGEREAPASIEMPEEVARWKADVLRTEDPRQREEKAKELLNSLDEQAELPEDVRAALKQEVAIELVHRSVADEKVEEATRHMLEGLAPLMPSNPRQVKRIINALTIAQEIVRLQDPSRGPYSPAWRKLARWVVLMIERPRSWATLTRRSELVDALKKRGSARNPGMPPELQEAEVKDLLFGNNEKLPQEWRESITTEDVKDWLAPALPATSGRPWPLPDEREQPGGARKRRKTK